MNTIQQQYENKFLPLIKAAINDYYFTDIQDEKELFDNATTFNKIETTLQSNLLITTRFLALVVPDRYLKCIYEFLTFNGCCTFPQLYSWFRLHYLTNPEKEKLDANQEPITERHLRRRFRDHFTGLEFYKIIKHQIVVGQKGTQNFYVTPFCSKNQYDNSTKKFKKYEEYIELKNKIFYDRKVEEKIISETKTCSEIDCNNIQFKQYFCHTHYNIVNGIGSS